MADFQNLVITDLANANRNVNRFQVEGQLRHSGTGEMLFDFTGANAIVWPDGLASLTVQQRRSILRSVIRRLILMRAGLDDGSQSDI
jgi:hypothetical protein